MFYVAEALLYQLGLTYSSHHTVTAAYGLHFAKTKKLDPYFHRALLSGFDMRQRGDYNIDSGIVLQDVALLIADATAFLAAARLWLDNNPPSSQ